MKKLKLSLIAVALLGTVSAFATTAKDETPCDAPSGNVLEGCQAPDPQLCCRIGTAETFAEYNP